jgi:hypothetical protein
MAALKAERYAYIRNGGGRDFRHEEAQDEAMRFVLSLGSGVQR